MNNIIILTSGLSGSSPLSGLIARGGFWVGETFKKPDYDTYENIELIGHNKRILAEAGYQGRYETEFSPEVIAKIASLTATVDPGPYREFVRRCDDHRPWVWKDPRLWLTIRFWRPLLDLDSTVFIVLTREHLQTWISTTIRRQIQTYAFHKAYADQVTESIVRFLDDNGARYHTMCFEDLLVAPERQIAELNRFLGTTLTLADFQAVYTKPLYRKTRGFGDLVKAVLIYLKNHGERLR